MEWPVDVLLIVLPIVLICAFVGSLGWVCGDAERRGAFGPLAALFVALVAWPLSLILWIVFRPKLSTPADDHAGRLSNSPPTTPAAAPHPASA